MSLPLFPELLEVGTGPAFLCVWEPSCTGRPLAEFWPGVAVAAGVTNQDVRCCRCGRTGVISSNAAACAHSVRTKCAVGA